MKNEQLFTSLKDNWRTPNHFWSNLDKQYAFWIDLAADENNAKCKLFIDKKQNALSLSWIEMQNKTIHNGYAWCNPPYGREVKEFLKKASAESSLGFKSVFLVAGRTDTKAFHNFIFNKASRVFFIEGRMVFDDENGKAANAGATFPSILVEYNGTHNPETEFFRMDKFGNVLHG